jgi:hypothetical protein
MKEFMSIDHKTQTQWSRISWFVFVGWFDGINIVYGEVNFCYKFAFLFIKTSHYAKKLRSPLFKFAYQSIFKFCLQG